MGRSYAALPAGLGPTVIRRPTTVHDSDPPFPSRNLDAGSAYRIVDGIQPMAQDELTAGLEVAIARTVRATLWAQGRWLRRGLDTTGQGFDNPGRRPGDPPATRDAELVAAELATSPAGPLTLRVGYLVGRAGGTSTGAFDPRQGAVLYAGTDYDFGADTRRGPRPPDVGHRVFVAAGRRGRLGAVEVEVATRLSVASGRPRNVLADTDIGIVQLVGRGSAGRGPMLTSANVRLAARWRGLELGLDVFNVFDRREPTSLDEIYTGTSVRAIDGGTAADLVFLTDGTGNPASRRTAYGLPLGFQAPISAVLGLHAAF